MTHTAGFLTLPCSARGGKVVVLTRAEPKAMFEAIVKQRVTEFFLPKDMPHFCAGCFSCFLRGENACPHADLVQPIARAIGAIDVTKLNWPGRLTAQ